ncbi:unnamed protein product [Dicrocoelium dendriticum]|nr:unnamed protein product [Dicrocoelium dendriticum]
MSGSSDDKNILFNSFYQEVKAIEQRDSVLTSKQQIDRLNRPGSTYFNLNPYDVLQVDPDTPLGDIKRKYRQLSLLVHPDKNHDDPERAKKAFDALTKAHRALDDPETARKCKEVVEEAKDRVEQMIVEKRKRLKKAGQPTEVEEDDPDRKRHAIYVQTCKLFADLERLRVEEEAKQSNERWVFGTRIHALSSHFGEKAFLLTAQQTHLTFQGVAIRCEQVKS